MIEFFHVSFCYEPGVPAVHDLRFTIHDGESVGLIGANGAGKSTLMQLLLGLLAGEGAITVDSLAVGKKNLAAIRQKIGFVFIGLFVNTAQMIEIINLYGVLYLQ